MTTRFTNPLPQFSDANGDPYSGGSLEFYESGTSTPLTTYSDDSLSTPNSNPLDLDSAGRPANPVFLQSQDYKVVLKDSGGGTVWTQDPVRGGGQAQSITYKADYTGASDVNLRDHLDTRSLPTYTELRAISPSDASGHRVVRVLGRDSQDDGGEGVFVWDGSDLSTEVGNDEVTANEGDGGIYVAPSSDKTGASGAWVRAVADMVHAAWYGLTDGSVETTALQALLNAAEGKTLYWGESATYQFDAQLTVPANVNWQNPNAVTLEVAYDASATNAPALDCGAGLTADRVIVNIATGYQVQRAIYYRADTHVELTDLSSVDQQDTRDDNIDGGVQIRGDDIKLGTVRVANWDYAVKAFQADRWSIQYLDVETYVQGFKQEDCAGGRLDGGYVRTTAPNGTTDPGHNGFLSEDCNSWSVSNLVVSDAGEHGFRIGGDSAFEWSWDNCKAVRSGQCGFKVNPSGTGTVRNGTINGCTAQDCSFGNAPGSNEDGLRLEKCEQIVVNGFICREVSSKAYDGIYINNCNDITINGPFIKGTANAGIYVDDKDGDVNGLFVNAPRIYEVTTSGIDCDFTNGNTARDLVFTECYIRGYGDYAVRFDFGATSVSVSQPCLASGYATNEGSGVYFEDANSATEADRLHNFMNTLNN